MDINMDMLQVAYKSFNKKTSDNALKNNTQNEELSTELNKPIVKIFEKIFNVFMHH